MSAPTPAPAATEAGAGRPGEPVLRIGGLNHSFGSGDVVQRVLHDIQLEINAGELVILTGPSGCGKTTLLTLIGALRSVQEGSLRVLGREMQGLGKQQMIAARREIGFIFQAHNLLEALTAAENVSLALELKHYTPEGLYEHAARLLGIIQNGTQSGNALAGVSHQIRPVARTLVHGLLDHLKLDGKADHKPNQLSGGQKQRVAIGRAVINHPRLILADEPTAALDKETSGVVIELLKKLTQHGSTILVVTHDNRIMDKGDRIVTMKDGRIASNILVDPTVRICIFLQKVDLFKGLTPSQLVEEAQKICREDHEAATTIIRQGEAVHEGSKFYMIKEGHVNVSRAEVDGSTSHLATLGPGQFFGEVALQENLPRNATVTAKERVELYTLRRQDFLNARASFESMRDELMKVFASRLPGR
jgi:putative ABC transport system ATP-binding protein